jgi:tRNA dimethylallyltransferase
MNAQRIIVIGGPTASGKSWVARELAQTLGGVVINADSMQVYAELPILTAQPDALATAEVPHRLYGVMSVRESCSAGRWAELAWREIDAAAGAGLLPIVAGGTGLYLRTLMRGLAPVPEIPADIRETTRALLQEQGPGALHARLEARDPMAAARIRPSDRQRLARAWEVLEATGRSLLAWQAEGSAPRPGGEFVTVVLNPERRSLYAAIDRRFSAMVDSGALAEARALAGMALPEEAPALKALGLRELMDHLAGRADLAAAIAAAQQASRRYAKRQMTWFRNQAKEANFISDYDLISTSMERILPKIFSVIRNSH